jgi:hypothetical protein
LPRVAAGNRDCHGDGRRRHVRLLLLLLLGRHVWMLLLRWLLLLC